MRRIQFSLRAVLGLVLFVAVACAALVNANELVATAVYSVTIFVLFVALVRGLFGAQSGRVFWLGFAIFGWGYLMLIWQVPLELLLGYSETPELATKKLLELAYRILERPIYDPFNAPPPAAAYPLYSFLTVGHSLFALMFGFVGGLLASYFHGTREEQT